MCMKSREEKIQDLYDIIASLGSAQECAELFADLCTNKEIDKMADRVYAARLLMSGKTYSEVIADTDLSSATLSRISNCVQYGNGYSKFLK